MKKAKIIAAVVLALLSAVIVLQNTEAVETKVLFISVSMPRAVLLFVTLILGFLIGVLAVTRISGKRKSDQGAP